MMNVARYDKNKLLLESTIQKRGLPQDWVDLRAIGYVEDRKGGPEAVYLSTFRDNKAQTLNTIQVP